MNKERKIAGKYSSDNFQNTSIEFDVEVDEMEKNYDCYCEVYKEL